MSLREYLGASTARFDRHPQGILATHEMGGATVMDRPFVQPYEPPTNSTSKADSPKPVDTVTRDDLKEYEALCIELGFKPTAIERNRVLQKFKSKRLPVYDAGEVDAYMTKITPSGKIWGWKKLDGDGRDGFNEDVRRLERSGISVDMMMRAGFFFGSNGAHLVGRYDKAIPMHILKRIKVVKDLFADEEPKFYVTDYEVPNPDPFVKAVLKCGEEVIFGMWDEPGFGDLKTEV